MSVGWRCGCGHMNIRKDARVGTHMLIDACDERCGKNNIMIPFEEVIE